MRPSDLARLPDPEPETLDFHPLRLLVVSDLFVNRAPVEWPAEMPAFDAMVVAGDVSADIETSLTWCAWARDGVGQGRPLVFVPGDADLRGPGPMREALRYAKERAAGLGIVLLADSTVRLDDGSGRGVHVVGSTLWTDWSLAGPGTASHARAYARRYWEGRDTQLDQGRPLAPHDVAGLHARSHAFIEDVLLAIVVRAQGFGREPSPLVQDVRFGDRAVVVSHHAPTGTSVPRDLDAYGSTPWRRAFFGSDLEAVMRAWGAPAAWVHGHVPSPVDRRIGATRVVANPRTGTGSGILPFVIEV
jgi:hypothetical protein